MGGNELIQQPAQPEQADSTEGRHKIPVGQNCKQYQKRPKSKEDEALGQHAEQEILPDADIQRTLQVDTDRLQPCSEIKSAYAYAGEQEVCPPQKGSNPHGMEQQSHKSGGHIVRHTVPGCPCDVEKALFLFLRLGAESDLLGQGSALNIRPHAFNGFGKLLRALRPKLRKGEDLQAAEQSVGNGAGKGRAAQLPVNRGKTALQRQKSPLFICRPNMLPLIAHGLDQLLVAAGLGKLDLIQAAAGIKLQKLVIELHCRIVGIHRQDTRHIAGDRGRVIAFQHTDSLVALLHIESAHILAAADGIPDPLVSQMRLTK